MAVLGLCLPLALSIFNGKNAKVGLLLIATFEGRCEGVLVLVGTVLQPHHLSLSHDGLDSVTLVVVKLLQLGPVGL